METEQKKTFPFLAEIGMPSVKSADIYTHSSPDGDAIGSSLALASILENAEIKARLFCEGPFPKKYSFLPISKFSTTPPTSFSESAFFLDCGDTRRLGETFSKINKFYELKIDIDHHVDNKLFGDLNVVDPNASSTAELLASIVHDDLIDSQIAKYLYVGIISDTYGFSTSTVSSKTFKIASNLLEKDISSNVIWKEIFRLPTNTFLFYADVLKYSERDRETIFSKVTKDLMDKYSISEEDTEGLANYLLQLKDIDTVVLLRERNGSTRLSFRSSGKKDVGEISRKLGGGGHKFASGAIIDQDLNQALSTVKQTLMV
ncbi:DHH family phosphoesterase [candidate division WOR-3 bacterium]|nr:DHH family phosphoesterase [candidate division WOR-3 bacterium]